MYAVWYVVHIIYYAHTAILCYVYAWRPHRMPACCMCCDVCCVNCDVCCDTRCVSCMICIIFNVLYDVCDTFFYVRCFMPVTLYIQFVVRYILCVGCCVLRVVCVHTVYYVVCDVLCDLYNVCCVVCALCKLLSLICIFVVFYVTRVVNYMMLVVYYTVCDV